MTITRPTNPGLHEVVPREQVGAVTGERYEFQFHQAASDALQVLDERAVVCVYCEWHDDYVIEESGDTKYRFHQVKTRVLHRGPWKLTDFFGHRRRAPQAATSSDDDATSAPAKAAEDDGSIFMKLAEHVFMFGERCSAFVFVTDAGLHTDFRDLLDTIGLSTGYATLGPAHTKTVESIVKGLQKADPRITPAVVFSLLKRLSVKPALGTLGDLRACRTLIGGRIRDLSEIDLRISEAEKIGAELVSLVRTKSHVVLNPLPADVASLRAAKGLVLDEVLQVLSLSSAGYLSLIHISEPTRPY